MKKAILAAWTMAAAVAAADAPSGLRWRVGLENGDSVETAFLPGTFRLQTPAGPLAFAPEDLERIEFAGSDLCVADTLRGDRWFAMVPAKSVARLAANPELRADWAAVRSVSLVGREEAAAVPASGDESIWAVDFQNGSRARLALEESTLRIRTESGRFDVPMRLVESVRMVQGEAGLEAIVELVPGGVALRGRMEGTFPKGMDLDGRRVGIGWNDLAQLLRGGWAESDREMVVFDQSATCRYADGTESKGRISAFVLSAKGPGGTWTLPSTRLRRMLRNGDGTFSVQTWAGDWLTGTVGLRELRLREDDRETALALSDVAALEWDGDAADVPEGLWTWRLATGDLLVGEWVEPAAAAPAASAAPLVRVRGTGGEADARLPRQAGGKWPLARFDVRHWAGGGTVASPASALEAVRAVAPERMPPAIPPAGPSAARSDEIFLEAGAFEMGRARGDGAPDEVPPVTVRVPSFWMANTPVTVAQFAAFAAAARHATDAERAPGQATWRAPGFAQRPDDPVVCVSWRDAVAYCNWLSSVSGLRPCYEFRARGREVVFFPDRNGYRLPLEAEWEYAARAGGRDVRFPWGDEDGEEFAAARANFRPADGAANEWPWTSPVKAFPASPAGLYDMAGNVWEWCQDVYVEDAYLRLSHGESMERMLNAEAGSRPRRAMRGGSFHNALDHLRCAARGFGVENMSAPRVGFRVARNAE